jgi:hypothetical protein
MRRQHRWSCSTGPRRALGSTGPRRALGSWAGVGLALALVGVSGTTQAAPIEASGQASAAAGEADRARDRAISAARKAALEQAIASVDTPVDPEAVAQVLARADAWTAGYRVLEVRSSTGGEVEVRIEAEIDLPRLRKRVAQSTAGARAPRSGFRWDSWTASGCPKLADTAILAPLRAYGIVSADADSSLTIAVTCTDRGAVSHTHVRAAAVELVAQTRGELVTEVRVRSQGFAEELDAATQIALDRAVAELADSLSVAARGDLELIVERPWPAARVAALSVAMRDAVLGVDAVELAGIAADGSVILRVGGSLDAHALARSLAAASFPGFALVGLRVHGAHALRVQMQ